MTAVAAAYGADQIGDLTALTDGFQAALAGAAAIAAVGAFAAVGLVRRRPRAASDDTGEASSAQPA